MLDWFFADWNSNMNVMIIIGVLFGNELRNIRNQLQSMQSTLDDISARDDQGRTPPDA